MRRFAPLLILLLGCASAPEKDPSAESEPSPLAGSWVASDPEVGTLQLTVRDGDELECELIDVRGARYAFEAEPEDDGRVEVELEPEGKGLQVLICRPETSLEVAGSMNYAKGEVVLTITPIKREGQEVAFLEVHRPDRKADTLRAVNLTRKGSSSR